MKNYSYTHKSFTQSIIKLLAITILSIFSPDFLTAAARLQHSYVLKFQLPADVQLEEQLCAFYKGHRVIFDNNWALLPETEQEQTFSIIITSEIEYASDGNTIRYRKRIGGEPLRWFDITLQLKQVDATTLCNSWNINELKEADCPLRIPDHAIIVILDPQIIQGLKIDNEPAPLITKGHVLQLPAIVIDPKVTAQQLKTACEHAQLASPDLRTLHDEPKKTTKKEHLAVIALHNQP